MRGMGGRPGNQRLGLLGITEAAPHKGGSRRARGCLTHKARPQLLPLPGTNNPELKTAQAKQQEQAGQFQAPPSPAREPQPEDSSPGPLHAVGQDGVVGGCQGLSQPGATMGASWAQGPCWRSQGLPILTSPWCSRMAPLCLAEAPNPKSFHPDPRERADHVPASL